MFFHRKLPLEKYTNTRSLLENSISCNLTHLPTTYLRNKVNTEFPLNFHEQASLESGSSTSRGWEEKRKIWPSLSQSDFPTDRVHNHNSQESGAWTRTKVMHGRETRFWIMYAPIERPMINDVDPLLTSEKCFNRSSFFLAFFSHGHLAPYLLDLLFYQLFIIYTLARERFLGGNFNDFAWFISGKVSFFPFCKLYSGRLFRCRTVASISSRKASGARVYQFDYAQLRAC